MQHASPKTAGFDQLLAHARAGSQEALGHLLESCRPYLLRIGTNRLRQQLRAKVAVADLVQDTFLSAHRDFASFRGTSKNELLSWLRLRLLDNAANLRRRYGTCAKRQIAFEVPLYDRRVADGHPEDLPARTLPPSIEVEEWEQAQMLHRTVQELQEPYRQVIMLRFLGERDTYARMGLAMNCRSGKVRRLVRRALEQLARKLKRFGLGAFEVTS